ncbi:MAG: hypothetical protein JWM28_198, partial [Chitinophagaceae bacterium]|nr:hypothetical protein [Chitinophagaceae bacterium]
MIESKTVKSENMRNLILPLVVFLLCSSVRGFSQGSSCAAPHIIAVDGSCNNYPMSTVTGSQSTGASCGATYPATKRITWFSFTPASNIMAASFLIQLDSATQMQATIYDPGNTLCSFSVNTALATLCAAGGSGTLMTPASTVLVSGRTYYIRVYANTISTTSPHIINICATPVTKQTIPVNGSCNNYPIAPLGTGANFSPLPTGTTNRCGYANNRRVTWFQFTPSITITCATFNIQADVPNVNTEIAFYNSSGAYQSGSTLCLPDGNGIWAPALPFTLTANQTYYLRIYTDINDNAAHNLNICASTYVQPNDLCSTATQIDNNGIQANNVCATGSGASSPPYEPSWITMNSQSLLCAPVLQNTAWYYFVVNNNTISTTVSVSSVNCDNYGGGGTGSGGSGAAGIQLGLLQGPSNMASCVNTNALFRPPNTPITCFQTTATSFGFTVPPNASIPNGTKMYIAVDGYSGANCSYIISTGNAIPIPVKLKYFTVWKQAQSNQVRWITSWETGNKNFEIERSYDGTNFTYIGRVDGAG